MSNAVNYIGELPTLRHEQREHVADARETLHAVVEPDDLVV